MHILSYSPRFPEAGGIRIGVTQEVLYASLCRPRRLRMTPDIRGLRPNTKNQEKLSNGYRMFTYMLYNI